MVFSPEERMVSIISQLKSSRHSFSKFEKFTKLYIITKLRGLKND